MSISVRLRILLKNFPDRLADFGYRVGRFDAAHPSIDYELSYEDSLYEEGDLDYDEELEPDEQDVNPNWVYAELTFGTPEDRETFLAAMGLPKNAVAGEVEC